MRADSVLCKVTFEKNEWHFISFQYDVQMSDVYALNNTDYVIRQYNSAKRAAATGDQTEQTGASNNWEDVPADGVLQAGKGYIIQAANNTTNENGNYNDAVVVFPSRNTVTKNRLFTSNDIIVPLEEYAAEFAHNRSWNLVGNPYPCYFSMNQLKDEFYSPIVLWTGDSYQAYSPIDDDIILRPYESFFVQRPIDVEQMVFGARDVCTTTTLSRLPRPTLRSRVSTTLRHAASTAHSATSSTSPSRVAAATTAHASC